MSLAPAARQRLLSLRRKAALHLLARQEKHFFSLQPARKVASSSLSRSPPSASFCARNDVERRGEDSEEGVGQEEKKKERKTNERKERRSEDGRQDEGEKQRGVERRCFHESDDGMKRREEEEELRGKKEKKEEEEAKSKPAGRNEEKESNTKDRAKGGTECDAEWRGISATDTTKKKKKNSKTSSDVEKARSAREKKKKKKRKLCSVCQGYLLDREDYERLGLVSGDGESGGVERDFELGFASLDLLPRRGLRMIDLSFTIPRDGAALLPLARALPHLPLLLFLDVSSCALDTEVVDSFREVSASSSSFSSSSSFLLPGGEGSKLDRSGLGGRDSVASPLSPVLGRPPVSPSSSSSSSISYPYSLVVRGLPLTAIRLDEEDETEEEVEEKKETTRSERNPAGDQKERGGIEGGGVYESYPSAHLFHLAPASSPLLPPSQVNLTPSLPSSSSSSSHQVFSHLPGDEVSIHLAGGGGAPASVPYHHDLSSLSCTPLPFSSSALPHPPSLASASSSPADFPPSLEKDSCFTQSLALSSLAFPSSHPPQMLSDSLHERRFISSSQPLPPPSSPCRYSSEAVERCSSFSSSHLSSSHHLLSPSSLFSSSKNSSSCSPPPPGGGDQLVLPPPPPNFYTTSQGGDERGGEQEAFLVQEQERRLSSSPPPLPPPRLISQAELKEEHNLLQKLTQELKPQLFPDQIEQLERLRELQEEQILLQQKKEELEQAFLTQLSASASAVCTAGGGGLELGTEAGRSEGEKQKRLPPSPCSSSFHAPLGKKEKKEEGEEQEEKEEEERRMITDPLEWLGTASPS